MIREMYWYVLVAILMEIQSPSYSVPPPSQLHNLLAQFYPKVPRSKMGLFLLMSICPGENSGFEITGK